MFVGEAGSLPLSGASLGYAPTLPANIRLGWKGKPGTNALAYYVVNKLVFVPFRRKEHL